MTNEDFLRNWYQTVWISQDFAAGKAAFSEGTRGTYVAGSLQMQPSDYETLVSAMCRDFQPREVTLSNVISQGPEISALVGIVGERISDRAPVKLEVHVYRRIENGQFVSSYSSADHIGFFIRMGQLPEDMMSTLMMGGSMVERS